MDMYGYELDMYGSWLLYFSCDMLWPKAQQATNQTAMPGFVFYWFRLNPFFAQKCQHVSTSTLHTEGRPKKAAAKQMTSKNKIFMS